MGDDSFDLAQDRNKWQSVLKPATKFRIPAFTGNFLTRLETITFPLARLHGVSYLVYLFVCLFVC